MLMAAAVAAWLAPLSARAQTGQAVPAAAAAAAPDAHMTVPFSPQAVPLPVGPPTPTPTATLLAPAPAGPTLAAVRAAGVLTCAANSVEADYIKTDTHGPLTRLAEAVCRAVAAAVLGDPSRARFLVFPDDDQALRAVHDGRAALFFGATPDITNETSYGVAFGPIVLHDGEGFLVNRRSGIRTIADLNGKLVCFISETEMEAVLPRLRRAAPGFRLFPFEEMGEMEAALSAGRCAAIAADLTSLAASRTGFHGQIPDFVLLPQTISNDPIAPAFRQGDPQWAQVVTWTINALTLAEENGVTRANVDTIDDHGDVELRRLLGRQDGLGRRIGLTDAFARNAVRAVGNYGEMFVGTVGTGSPLKLPRGEDRLARDGGVREGRPMR